MTSKRLLIITLGALMAIVLASCAGPAGETGPAGSEGPPGPQGEAGTAGCVNCHNDTTVIFAANQQWELSSHGSGTSWARGKSASCAGCHSHEGFVAMIEAGITPDDVETAPAVSSSANCRTCHQIHSTYTADDWALSTSGAVVMYAFDDTSYDGGEGNLCANCHQSRHAIEDADDAGMIEVEDHWGPHHGPQTAMLLGIGGAGDVTGSPGAHYSMVEDTCVSCHVSNLDHTFAPVVSACTGCHADAEDLDINGLQTEVEALLEELQGLLEEAGLLADDEEVVGTYPAAQAQALWNYLFIAVEDSSLGVHNPSYTKALLEASIAAFETE